MPLQNRVTPFGEIEAVAARGTMLGNRGGKFHRDDRTLGRRRWASHHWICCELHYKNMHHEAMGRGYTSLFFLDEVTALAAGHRPCFFCRRQEAKAFMALAGMSTDAFDRMLHAERLGLSSRISVSARSGTHSFTFRDVSEMGPGFRRDDGAFVDGTMVTDGTYAYAIRQGRFLRWSHEGYSPAQALQDAKLLTPPAIAAILAKGYQPRWHSTAY
jgi:hypothetical protein